ncbi:MAG: NAD-dependent epimerase/dehydratase family protein [Acidobacteria bacterium]|nr:NAD-dependent epimerase/dehydratase family protein [Acidobacteriota bacterium]
MRVLVTGGSGYIGTRLLEALATRPDVEEILDVDVRPPRAPIPKVRHVARSVADDLRAVFTERPIDLVMHLAWVLDPLHDAARQRHVCIDGTQRVLEGCAAGGVRHLLFVSSATAYGAHPAHDHLLREDEPLREEFHFQYSAEKREAEGLCRRFADERPGMLLQVARPCVVGGPNVSNFIFRSMEKPVVPRPLGTDPEVQLVHEDDVAAALVAIVASRLPGAFNVAADGTLRLSEIARRMNARLLSVPWPLLRALAAAAWHVRLRAVTEAPPGYLYFVRYPWLVSNRRLREEVGFRFRFTADQVLGEYMAARPSRAAA